MVPEFKGDNRWHSHVVQFNTIMKMNEYIDNDGLVYKLMGCTDKRQALNREPETVGGNETDVMIQQPREGTQWKQLRVHP